MTINIALLGTIYYGIASDAKPGVMSNSKFTKIGVNDDFAWCLTPNLTLEQQCGRDMLITKLQKFVFFATNFSRPKTFPMVGVPMFVTESTLDANMR